MLKFLLFGGCFLLASIGFSQFNLDSISRLDLPTIHNQELNDIWGYVDHDGNEHALVGCANGFSYVDISNPSDPQEVFFISGSNSVWRDLKTWGNYAYVTTESDTGLLIIDLSDMSGNTYWHVKDFISDNLNDTIHFEAS